MVIKLHLYQNHKQLSHIPVVVNSSMTTDAVIEEKCLKLVLMDLLERQIFKTLFRLTKKFLIQ